MFKDNFETYARNNGKRLVICNKPKQGTCTTTIWNITRSGFPEVGNGRYSGDQRGAMSSKLEQIKLCILG